MPGSGGTTTLLFDTSKFTSSDPDCPILTYTFSELTSPTNVLTVATPTSTTITVPTDTVRGIGKSPPQMEFRYTVATLKSNILSSIV